MWNPIFSLLSATLLWANAAIFSPDPSIQDPRKIWLIETEMPRNNLRAAMRARGLAPGGGGAETRTERFARAVLVRRLLERVNEAYRRRPDGTAVPGRSLEVTFCDSPPDDPRSDGGPGRSYSRICVGGAQMSCGGTLGTEYLDYGNRVAEEECSPGRIGVFAGRICGLRSRLVPPLETSEARFVDGSYRVGDGSRGEDERFLDVRAALEDWGTALGNVTAHEIGHALGLDHDRGSGYVMQARISTEDLSSETLAMSPQSLRQLASDVGLAALPCVERDDALDAGRRSERRVLESDRETTLGALARRAVAIGVRDDAGRLAAVLDGASLRDPELAGVPPAGAGVVFVLGEGQGAFVEADVPAVRDAIVARLRAHLARRGRVASGATGTTGATAEAETEGGPAAGRDEARGTTEAGAGEGDLALLAEGLSSGVPRVAADAALDLLAALESGRAPSGEHPALAERVTEALARNASALGDLRTPIRLAGRLGARDSADEIIAAVASEDEIDLSAAAAEALHALGAREALARQAAVLPRGPGRDRLLRTLSKVPMPSMADAEALLAHEEHGVFLAAARSLLRAGPLERRRLFERARRLPPPRRAAVEALRERPRP